MSVSDCLADCSDAYADSTSDGTEDELLCAEALADAESCVADMGCDELNDLYEFGTGCESQEEAAAARCGL